ncbi:MAG: hypothetical protein ACI35O_10795 [Bacillaceae bacterium]
MNKDKKIEQDAMKRKAALKLLKEWMEELEKQHPQSNFRRGKVSKDD